MKILYINTNRYDYLTSSLTEGLNDAGHEVFCSEKANYGKQIPLEHLQEYGENADLIIIGSDLAKSYLVQNIQNPNKVFVDGSDYQFLNVPSNIRFKAVFKRELNKLHSQENIYPLPFASEKRYFPAQYPPKDILVSFLANVHTNTFRYSILERLKRIRRNGIVVGSTGERSYNPAAPAPEFQPTPKYHNLIARSLISVNVVGAGWDCARYWEILAARSMLFTQKLDIQIPFPFQDGVNCVEFETFAEFEDKLEYYMNNPDKAIEIIQKAWVHLCKYHTTKARAEYFIEKAKISIQKEGYCKEFLHQ